MGRGRGREHCVPGSDPSRKAEYGKTLATPIDPTGTGTPEQTSTLRISSSRVEKLGCTRQLSASLAIKLLVPLLHCNSPKLFAEPTQEKKEKGKIETQ